MSKTLRYTPLNELTSDIRLINLLPPSPGHDTSPISCTSFAVSLDTWPQYEALSYTWGDANITDTIEVDGHAFNVTANLFSALKQLRTEDKPRTLWIDALSIDQSNEAEKSWQVNLMGLIYAKSERGLLWVGKESEEGDSWCISLSKDCFRLKNHVHCPHGPEFDATFPRICDHCWSPHPACKWHGRRPRISQLVDLVQPLERDKHLNLIPSLANLARSTGASTFESLEPIIALSALLDRSWWSRIWTVQEAVMPPDATILCGTFECSFNTLGRAAENLREHALTCCSGIFAQLTNGFERITGEPNTNMLTKFHNNLHYISRTQERITAFIRSPDRVFSDADGEKEDGHTLLNYWYTFNNRQAKDTRDKVYALLGLLPPTCGVFADYKIDMTQMNKTLSIKLLVECPDKPFSVLWRDSEPNGHSPSWVKDFGEHFDQAVRQKESTRYNAANGNVVQIRLCIDDIISVVGIQADNISKIGLACNINQSTFMSCGSIIRKLARTLDIPHRGQEQHPTGCEKIEAFASMLTGGYYVLSEEHPYLSPDAMMKFVRSLQTDSDENVWIDSAIAYAFVTVAHKRRLFFTSKGFFGLGPEWMKPGDEVWVLFGSTVPFALRPQKNEERGDGRTNFRSGSENYCVMGDCYVQGIMFGEAAKDTSKAREIFLR